MRNFIYPAIILGFLVSPDFSNAAEPSCATKYALLAAVTMYEQMAIDKPQLAYPEADATELGEFLRSFGYDVDIILGKQATRDAIRQKCESLNTRGDEDGVVLIGLFGCGLLVQAGSDSEPEGFFCPYDSTIQDVRSRGGKPLINNIGEAMTELDPSKLIKVSEILSSLKAARAKKRIVLADWCRRKSNQLRVIDGVDLSFKVSDIPDNTSVFFGCSPNQQAFEHKDWGHGAFTRCLLDELRNLASNGEFATTGVLAERLAKKVPTLVATKNAQYRQTPMSFLNGSIDLQLTLPTRLTFAGGKAGDRRELVPGVVFRWCPSGTFMMGSPMTENDRSGNEGQTEMTLTMGFWLGETEVSQDQWRRLTGMTPWRGEHSVKEDGECAASYISHHEAVSYCNELTSQEHIAGRLPKGWKFSLPTEAQWEYACRAGTKTMYSFGDSELNLGEYAWFDKNAYKLNERHAHRVGQKKPNPWGLKDMHGNLSEWCSDWYDAEPPRDVNLDPATRDLGMRVDRGGCWAFSAAHCRSAYRDAVSPEFRSCTIGFRLAAIPE